MERLLKLFTDGQIYEFEAERALFLGENWRSFLNYQEVSLQLLHLADPYFKGEDVRQIQTALAAKGFSVSIDGVFSPGTDKAVKAFQQKQGCVADGLVGQKTRQALGLPD